MSSVSNPTLGQNMSSVSNPLHVLFAVYCAVMESVHPYQILLTVQQDLCGLKQCVQKGPNEDRTPSPRIRDYYAWMTWKKFTLMLMDKTWTAQRFKEVAIKNYISTAHKYLCRLGLYPPPAPASADANVSPR